MQLTNKPQCIAARNYVEAMHMHARGEITREELDKIGQALNGAIQLFGRP